MDALLALLSSGSLGEGMLRGDEVAHKSGNYNLWQNFISSGIYPDGHNELLLRKVRLTNWFGFIGILAMMISAPSNYFYGEGREAFAQIYMTAMPFMVLALLYLRKTQNVGLAGSIVLLILTIIMLSFFFMGGQETFDIVWLLTYPPIALYLKGLKSGSKWIAIFISLIVLIGFLGHIRYFALEYNTFSIVSMLSGIIFICFFIGLYERDKTRYEAIITEKNEALAEQKQKTENLLLNILPAPIAERLKSEPDSIIADRYESVTVIFADIVNFTHYSAQYDANEVVDTLNGIFSEFDRLSKKYRMEKIKTIGDSYMAAGGIPTIREGHEHDACAMALEMIGVVRNSPLSERGLRIGIHTGEVVAGVMGKMKFIYDLWGDTVNVASRMESHGERDRIQVTASLFEKCKDSFSFEYRGEVVLKNRGKVETYWLTGHRNG